jgi:hypothetical protein
VIVSMLQKFVLRTILEYFYGENNKAVYEIQIQESRIKDSKMQPFLVFIKRIANSEAEKMK